MPEVQIALLGQREAEMMPQTGDIKLGVEIGNTQWCKFIWSACIDCGKERWVKVVHGMAQSPRCNSCASKKVAGIYPRKTLAERFWAKVLKTDGCWLWQGYINPITGYGQANKNQYPILAHRLAYELTYGKIPEGKFVLHKPPCNNRLCVRPEHLYLGTHRDNMDDMVQSKTLCLRGHPYDDANTYHRPDGNRDCKACMKIRAENHRARQEVVA